MRACVLAVGARRGSLDSDLHAARCAGEKLHYSEILRFRCPTVLCLISLDQIRVDEQLYLFGVTYYFGWVVWQHIFIQIEIVVNDTFSLLVGCKPSIFYPVNQTKNSAIRSIAHTYNQTIWDILNQLVRDITNQSPAAHEPNAPVVDSNGGGSYHSSAMVAGRQRPWHGRWGSRIVFFFPKSWLGV